MTPGGSNPEHQCTPPISMPKACGRHFRRHAANARPIGPPRLKAPATLPIRRERRLRQSPLAKAATTLAEPIDRNPEPFSAATCQSRYVLRAFEEQILQHHSIVMRLVMRGEHQRMPDLRLVAPPELLPAFRIMAEPLSQFGTWRNLFHPFIDRGISLLHSTGP